MIDKNNGIATASITLVVGPGLSLTFGTPPTGQVGVPYTDTLTAAGGTTPYTWSVSAGTLPRRDHAERLDRGAGGHPDRGRYLQLHHQGDRRDRPDRHPGHLDHHPGRRR